MFISTLSDSTMPNHLSISCLVAVVITFTAVPADSLLSFALDFAFTSPELLDHGEYLILGDLIVHLFVFTLFTLISSARNLKHVRC